MPLYAELRRLDLWDEGHRELMVLESGTRLEMLLVAIDEFAGFNLYSRFQVEQTQLKLRDLVDLLSQHGITVQVDASVEGW